MKHLSSRTGLEHAFTRKIKVYDVAKKELIFEFDSMNQAKKELGVNNINQYIKNKGRCHKNNLGITICFR
jgi:hypothetical protein